MERQPCFLVYSRGVSVATYHELTFVSEIQAPSPEAALDRWNKLYGGNYGNVVIIPFATLVETSGRHAVFVENKS